MQRILVSSEHVSLARRIVPAFSAFAAIGIATLLLAWAALEVLSAARSYVVGEGLWSKGQRDAVYALTLYGQTRDPAYFRQYRVMLAIPLGDRAARLEMEKPDYDPAAAYAGLLQGGNHPGDIPGMIRLFRCCAEYSYFARAVAIWRQGDEHIVRLDHLGEQLQAEITSAHPSRARIAAILAQVHAEDAAVKPLENAFTATLGEGMRRLKQVLAWTVSGIVLALVAAGAYVAARAYAGLREAEKNYRIVADALVHSGEGVMILDAKRRIIGVNPAFSRITGCSFDEVAGTTLTHPPNREVPGPTYDAIWQEVGARGLWEGEAWGVRKDGGIFPQRLGIRAVRNGDSGATHHVVVFNDISSHKAYEQRLEHLARHDPLTGVANRAEFEHQCQEAFARARRQGRRVAVLFIDLDGFKIVNDVHGHTAGDELLRIVAARLASTVRETDLIARLGGDEFGVLIADMDDPGRSAIVARKLLDALVQPVPSPSGTHVLGASIGISVFPIDGDDVGTLLRFADAAMYAVKQNGGNGYRFHAPG